MILLAAPHTQAICVPENSKSILKTPSVAVLSAMRRIRKAEASSGDTRRLLWLDQQIDVLKKRNGGGESSC